MKSNWGNATWNQVHKETKTKSENEKQFEKVAPLESI
jgi:hypothetical protein